MQQLFNVAKKLPLVNRILENRYDAMMADLEHSLKPYRDEFPAYARLPEKGLDREEILEELEAIKAKEEERWQTGLVSGAVYHGDSEYIEFLNRAYAMHSQTNPLHADLFPGITQFESEIIAMTAGMLGADKTRDEIVGTVTSGGTESILLAMKTYRDYARDQRGVTKPELVIPVTAHAAFDKAAEYFNIKLVKIPVDKDFRADLKALKKAINKNTIAIVGSAPSFPHGIIDPIPEMAKIAQKKRIGLHVDGCLGGFVLPWAEKLGYPVPPFDFRLPGVTSMSADTHKYGYAAKGTSVVLYRGRELRHYQYFTITDWSGGLYFSPTFAGSRPGGLIAACRAALLSMGESGYMDATRRILETADWIKAEIRKMPELHLMGDPLWVIAFASDSLNIYRVMDQMSACGWSLNGLHKPSCVHLAVTLRHTQPDVKEKFIADLREAVAHVKATPSEKGGMAPVYGMAASLPVRSVISDILKRYLDVLYKV